MIAWNDRRKAKKAASATMKTTLGMMAKTGALRGTTPPPKEQFAAAKEKRDNKDERKEVLDSAARDRSSRNYAYEVNQSPKRMSKRESIDSAASYNDMKRKRDGKSKY
jgi:hypothetical protein